MKCKINGIEQSDIKFAKLLKRPFLGARAKVSEKKFTFFAKRQRVWLKICKIFNQICSS